MLTCGVAAILLACCSDGLGFTTGEAIALWPFKCEGVAATVDKDITSLSKYFIGHWISRV